MKRLSLLLLPFIIVLTHCKDEPEAPQGSNKISFKNTSPIYVKYNQASVSTTTNMEIQNDQVGQHGHCWSTDENPSIDGEHTSLSAVISQNKFTSNLYNLNENTTYFIRPYIFVSDHLLYGTPIQITTNELTLPTINTANITNLTSTTAQCGGNVTNDGNGTVSARGVVWNTAGNPTLQNYTGKTTDGNGTGSFTSTLTGLTSGTTYYVAAYATNEEGAAYGSVKSFEILSCGVFTVNYGGKTYNTVQIGSQCWFKENLNIGTKIAGSQNQTNNQMIEKYCYGDNEANCDTYGGLYQWDEMMQYTTTQGTKGICPDGWHIPTDAEWTTLTDYLGGSSVAGGKMKETGTAHWNSPNTGATNSSGFTALPGGGRYGNGFFDNLGYSAYFWSSTVYNSGYAWYRVLFYDSAVVFRYYDTKSYGFGVRCLQD